MEPVHAMDSEGPGRRKAVPSRAGLNVVVNCATRTDPQAFFPGRRCAGSSAIPGRVWRCCPVVEKNGLPRVGDRVAQR